VTAQVTPVRLLLVELDQDDQATRTLARALRDEGAEVVYTFASTADEVAVAAAQEDVRAVGFVVRTDQQRSVVAEVAGRDGIVVFATANGDEPVLLRAGVAAVFPPESGEQVVTWAGKQT
jgi:methylmalonyl-CoA mutase cobalamin-binding domain/chain